MHKLAVIGNPIAHSLSPLIFTLFAQECQVELSYNRLLATDNNQFNQIALNFFQHGGLALNTTSPFKRAAYALAKDYTMRSRFCQASNLLTLGPNQIIQADTTDGLGLVQDVMVNNNYSFKDKAILILGSGYVVESILLDFIVQNPKQIDILARNQLKVAEINKKFFTGIYSPLIKYDMVFNTAPNTANNQLFLQIKQIADGGLCYDLSYAKQLTLFLLTMQKINPQVICCNGLGMLVEQAYLAFIKLFAKKPNTRATLKSLSRMGYNA